MTTPTITLYPDTLPAKGQANAAFDVNVDDFLTWLTLTNGPELAAMITYTDNVAATVLANALAGNLPPLTGKAGNYLRANSAENGGEFRTPAEVLSDIGAPTVASVALKAPLASPAFTGVPLVPTATVGTNTTQAASTAFVLANAPLPGVTVISETVVSTGVASIDLTGFDASLYTSYEIELMNLEAASEPVFLNLRTSTDGGSTYDSGGSDYAYIYRGADTQPADISGQDNTNSAAIIASTVDGGNSGVSGVIRLSGPHLAKKTKGVFNFSYTRTFNILAHVYGGFERNSNADVDGVQIYFSAGNISGGTVVFRGIK
jgi:hypothetical protein